ncbi:MAG: CHASE2 domain-containing protein [Bacillota bacterium]
MKVKPYQLVIPLIILFICFFAAGVFDTLEWSLQDYLYQKRGTTDTRIIIIGIDEKSLEKLGRWPWGRDRHARLIDIVSGGKPAVIGVDIIFSEPSADVSEDEAMIASVRKAGNVILPVYAVFSDDHAAGRSIISALDIPIRGLAENAKTGHINTIPEKDGIIRKTPLYFEYNGERVFSFAWQVYSQFLKYGGRTPDLDSIPLDAKKRMNIAFTGKPGDYGYLSFADVLDGKIPPEYFEGKIVLVGPCTVGIQDYYFTPIARHKPMYGVEIHANIIQNLINQNYKKEIPFVMQLCILALAGVIGLLVFNRFHPLKTFLALLLLAAAYIAAAVWFYSLGMIIPVSAPILLPAGSYFVILAYRYLDEMLERKRITGVFGRYVAPQVVRKILEEGEAGLKLGGTRREITVLFVDIRGFTPLSENAQPEEVVAILNEYLSLCADAIFRFEGTLDKFIGDAAMAIFNAPLDLADHEYRAVCAAWAMKSGAGELEKKLTEKYGRGIRFGIGINTGPAVVGNIGASFRLDYTAIGDTVNTAARLESNAKAGQILLSQSTYDKVKDRVYATPMGEIKVKGKSQGIAVYQLDGLVSQEAV